MPIILSDGVNEVEDTTSLPPSVMSKGQGIEYRIGLKGPHVARGRLSTGWTPGSSPTGLYSAQFDNGRDQIVAQVGNSLSFALIQSQMSTAGSSSAGSGPAWLTGCHYGNRHYLSNGVTNVVFEMNGAGPSFRTPGMGKPSFTIGVSVTQSAGSMTVVDNMYYWVTEYDSVRGIESIYGTTAGTGAFTSKDSVILTVTGSKVNPNADSYRVYRTTDTEAFPAGGLLATLASGVSTYTDTLSDTTTALTPVYGTLNIGGLDFDRDVQAPVLQAISGPFQNSLLGWPLGDPHSIAYTEDGYPESWPAPNFIPVQTERNDIGIGFVILGDFCGAFTRDTVWTVARLPRSADSAFAAGEAAAPLTKDRGAISPSGLAAVNIPGGPHLAVFVARDGIWATDLSSSPSCLTDGVAWDSRVNTALLADSILLNDSTLRRLIFLYAKAGDSTHTGVMYLDYQTGTFRITHPDHGALAAGAVGPWSNMLRGFAIAETGTVYVEAVQDKDDSLFTDSSGSVQASIKTAQIFIADTPFKDVDLRVVSYRHSATTARVEHRLFFDQNPIPHYKLMDFSDAEATEVGATREVNTVQLQLDSIGTQSWGLHWIDIEALASRTLGAREGG